MERRTTEQPNDVFAREFGFHPPLSSEDIGERLKPSRRRAIRFKKRGGHTHAKRVGADAVRTKFKTVQNGFFDLPAPIAFYFDFFLK